MIVNTLIASFLMTGAITIFYLSDNLQAVPLGMIGISFAITSFATLSELASEEDKQLFADEIKRVMGQVLFLILPATIGMLVLRSQIIEVILVYGKFTAEDAALTSQVLGFLLISLFAQSLIPILARGFYAFHDTKTPLLAGAIGVATIIGGSLLLALGLNMGIVGIAIAFSIGHIIYFGILYVLMQKKIKLDILHWPNIFKIVIVSTMMGSLVQIAKILAPFGGNTVNQILLLVFYTLIGLVVYFSMAAFLGMKEFKTIWRYFRKLK
jgi:putative peptidoglycan lipid II flippase